MVHEEKRKKNRIRYMISSVIIAIIAWSVVTYATDPDITKRLNGIRVELTGVDVLAERGLVVTNSEEIPKTWVKMRGKRSDLMKAIDKSKLIIDVSNIKDTGDFTIESTVKLPNSRIIVESVGMQNVTVSVAKLETRDIPVKVTQTGELEGKLVKSEPENQTVPIKGASSELDMISAVEVVVDVSAAADSQNMALGYSLVIKHGEDRDALSTIKISDNVITVKNTVYNAKEVPVKAIASGTQGKMLDATETVIEPEEVIVGVKDDADISEVTVTVDETMGEGEYKVNKPDGVYLPPESRTVKVTPVWLAVQ